MTGGPGSLDETLLLGTLDTPIRVRASTRTWDGAPVPLLHLPIEDSTWWLTHLRDGMLDVVATVRPCVVARTGNRALVVSFTTGGSPLGDAPVVRVDVDVAGGFGAVDQFAEAVKSGRMLGVSIDALAGGLFAIPARFDPSDFFGLQALTGALDDQGHRGPPAGWYEDPVGRYLTRFWDGSAWTERVRVRGLVRVDPRWR